MLITKILFRPLKFLFILLNKLRLILFTYNLKSFGKRSFIQQPVCFKSKENIEIGDDFGIAAFTHIWGGGGVKIGNKVLIASHVAITSVTHDYNLPSIRFSKPVSKPVIIEDDVWIGSHAVILPGIKIEKGFGFAAGTVVTKDVPAYDIIAGVPGKIL